MSCFMYKSMFLVITVWLLCGVGIAVVLLFRKVGAFKLLDRIGDVWACAPASAAAVKSTQQP